MGASSSGLTNSCGARSRAGRGTAPLCLEVLEGVSAEAAAAHPVAGAHSIWELVLHLTGTYRLGLAPAGR